MPCQIGIWSERHAFEALFPWKCGKISRYRKFQALPASLLSIFNTFYAKFQSRWPYLTEVGKLYVETFLFARTLFQMHRAVWLPVRQFLSFFLDFVLEELLFGRIGIYHMMLRWFQYAVRLTYYVTTPNLLRFSMYFMWCCEGHQQLSKVLQSNARKRR